MKTHRALGYSFRILVIATFLGVAQLYADQPIQLADAPALSPDGRTVAFAYAGDIWAASTGGGTARRVTVHPATDGDPHFSPDGEQLAFVSDRSGSRQVYVTSADGSAPRQVSFHTEGYAIEDWYTDGSHLLLSGMRDHHWRHARRFFRMPLEGRSAERPIFDAYGSDASLSPDGKKLLLVREGERWWRKGYYGSRAAQIWLYDTATKKFTKLLGEPTGCTWPLWKPDGSGFYYVGAASGSFNLWQYDLKSKKSQQLTQFEDDSVVFPALSRDGSTIVFRRLFDLYVFRPGKNQPPKKLELKLDGDQAFEPTVRRLLTKATDVTFTADGLEMAFVAGGDLWVMDTTLKEPRQVTATTEEESNPLFSPDGKSILLVANRDGQADIYRAQRADDKNYWWQNEKFTLTRLTEDAEVESKLRFTPDGKHFAYVRGRGDLWLADADGKNGRRLVAGFDSPEYDFSPDGKWIVYAHYDDDFNRDIWLEPVDGAREPFNLSRHPDDDSRPVWSPDGKAIAFVGRRMADETDIYYVWLQAGDRDKSSRSRRVEQALEKINKVRKPTASKTSAASKAKAAKLSQTKIDFEGIHERLRRISVANSAEGGLFWSPDSKKLAATATVAGKRGTYTFDFPTASTPKLLSTTVVSNPHWLKKNNTIVGLADGVPSALSATGTKISYAFRAQQSFDKGARYRAAFDLCWRSMRDWWYDERLGNRNWDEVHRKYVDAAAAAPDASTFSTVVSLLLGELNGSHLGFSASRAAVANPEAAWKDTTAHLGMRFEAAYKGPGLKVRDVLPRGPADREGSRLNAGDVVLSIDGTAVDPAFDLTQVLNGRLDRDIRLRARSAAGGEKKNGTDTAGEREVTLRPISYSVARGLLYNKWTVDSRARVDEISGGKLGYLHIRAMNQSSFLQFERELYSAGYGKDGLVIDVRENGGGFTTDHLLTTLTQPQHAVTVPRGGGQGYPQSRMIYATWNKPIVVLCNQNSFSNAEIFSHAVKSLGRGKVVGVPTAGGVISTGAVRIMDVGLLRRPFRGWFVRTTGQDMELNGAVPHVVVWPQPGDLPAGKDAQLDRAVKVLQTDVKTWQARPQPKLQKATER